MDSNYLWSFERSALQYKDLCRSAQVLCTAATRLVQYEHSYWTGSTNFQTVEPFALYAHVFNRLERMPGPGNALDEFALGRKSESAALRYVAFHGEDGTKVSFRHYIQELVWQRLGQKLTIEDMESLQYQHDWKWATRFKAFISMPYCASAGAQVSHARAWMHAHACLHG